MKRLLAPSLFALLVVLLFADPLFLHKNFGGRDLRGYSLPIEKAIHDAYSRGRLPLWLSDISGGRPLLANPNAGALYPVRPVLSLLPFPMAIRVFPILHWVIAGLGMMALGSTIGLSTAGRWVAGSTYALCGVSVSEVFYPNIQPGMALLPWLIWALHRPARWGVRVVVTGVVLSLLFLAGDVFVCSLGLVCALLWMVLEVPAESQKRSLGALGAALGLAALVAAPQIIATSLWIPVTNRAVLGMRLREALLFSVSPLRLLEFVIPYPFGTTWDISLEKPWAVIVYHGKSAGLFSGFYAGAFAVIAIVLMRRSRAAGARFAKALLLLTLVAAIVPSFVPDAWGAMHSPLPLRYPEKLVVGTMLALSILSGCGLDAFRRAGPGLRWVFWLCGALAAGSLACALLPGPSGAVAVRLVGAHPALAPKAARYLSFALAEGGLLWVATLVALDWIRRGHRIAEFGGLALLALVPLSANRRIAETFRQEELLAAPGLDRFASRHDPEKLYRTLGESSLSAISVLQLTGESADLGTLEKAAQGWDLYAHILWDRGTVLNVDYDHGDLSRLEILRSLAMMASSYLDSRSFFGSLSLRWGIRFQDQQALGGYRPFRNSGRQVWDEHERPFPAVRLLERWVETPRPQQAADALPRLGDGEVVLETEHLRRGVARPGRIQIREDTPERLLVDAETPDATWLFVLRGFWEHREVRVDGREVETVPATIAFTAVPIPPGAHRVDLREQLPGGRLSVWGPVLALGLSLVLIRRRDGLAERQGLAQELAEERR